ncbi:MAG: RHS repeat-associated core domain-containing protein [Chloroflexi bacterium]|nr:RHS repeat-associated core domain-containing protein [Chloroflexota bacterium]
MTLETGAASATYLRDPGGLLLSVSSGGGLSNYGRDRLGTITALTSGSQTLTDTYRYDPWGQSIGGSGSAYNAFRYTATYKDAATGLYQMGARYYQPASGRFTQLDPNPNELLSVNRYAYTGCNPTSYTDPTGLSHCPSWAQFLAQAVIGGAALTAIVSFALFVMALPVSLATLSFFIAFELALWGVIRAANTYNQDCYAR